MSAEDAAFLMFDSLDNLPSEITTILDEIRVQDHKTSEIRRKIATRDASLGKFIKSNSALVENPKEVQYYPKIRNDYEKLLKMSAIKEEQAKKGVELLDRYLRKLDDEVKKVIQLEMRDAPGGLASPGGLDSTTPSNNRRRERADSSASLNTPGGNTSHKRSRSVMQSSRPSVSSSLAQPPLLSNGYPAPPEPSPSRPCQNKADLKQIEVVEEDAADEADAGEDTTTYCFCEQVSYGEMVACDNDDCVREWFHYGCVGLKEPPVGKWYCSDCLKK